MAALDVMTDLAPETVADVFKAKRMLDLAALQVNVNFFGVKTDMAVALLAAHFVAMSTKGDKGQITQEKVGDLQVSYQSLASSKDALTETVYGRQFLALRKTIPITPLIV